MRLSSFRRLTRSSSPQLLSVARANLDFDAFLYPLSEQWSI